MRVYKHRPARRRARGHVRIMFCAHQRTSMVDQWCLISHSPICVAVQTEIGRVDSAEYAGAAIPALDADVETIRAWLTQLGAKPGAGSGPFTPKPPFWEQPGFVLWCALDRILSRHGACCSAHAALFCMCCSGLCCACFLARARCPVLFCHSTAAIF